MSLCSCADARGDLPPQPRRFQHVGLVDRGDFLAPRRRPVETPTRRRAALRSRDIPACRWRVRGRRTTSRFFAPKYSPPVNSRTTMMSTPCSFSGFNGDASINAGCTFTGRKFANTCPALCATPAGRARVDPSLRDHPTWGRPLRRAAPRPIAGTPSASRRSTTIHTHRSSSRPSGAWSYSNVWPNFCAIDIQHAHGFTDHFRADAITGKKDDLCFQDSLQNLTRRHDDRMTR